MNEGGKRDLDGNLAEVHGEIKHFRQNLGKFQQTRITIRITGTANLLRARWRRAAILYFVIASLHCQFPIFRPIPEAAADAKHGS